MLTIKQILLHVMNEVTLPDQTVDTLLYGDQNEAVTGIAVMFMPTIRALTEAKANGCNLIFTHEGLFFNHWKDPHVKDTVHEDKQQLLSTIGLNIFRFHDTIHLYTPDRITDGLTSTLFPDADQTTAYKTYTVVEFAEARPFQSIRQHIKAKLNLTVCRYIGHDETAIKRIGLSVGYRGNGEYIIPKMSADRLDLIIYGEGFEWETPEYVRDSLETRDPKSLIVLGHYESEAPGMALFTDQLARDYPGLPVHYIDSHSPFDYDV